MAALIAATPEVLDWAAIRWEWVGRSNGAECPPQAKLGGTARSLPHPESTIRAAVASTRWSIADSSTRDSVCWAAGGCPTVSIGSDISSCALPLGEAPPCCGRGQLHSVVYPTDAGADTATAPEGGDRRAILAVVVRLAAAHGWTLLFREPRAIVLSLRETKSVGESVGS